MKYSVATIEMLRSQYLEAHEQLGRLILDLSLAASAIADTKTREYMQHGVGRRLKSLLRCMERVFSLFPPNQEGPLSSDDLADVQIYLQAFILNTYGCFENLAWAFVLRHGLEDSIGDRRRIGLFCGSTQRFLPPPLRDHLVSPSMVDWQRNYLKNFRDALAHRIPLYVPPVSMTQAEADRHNALEQECFECIRLHQFERLEELRRTQEGLGSVCLLFVHAYDADIMKNMVYVHGQLLSDVRTILGFVPLFLAHWHEMNPGE